MSSDIRQNKQTATLSEFLGYGCTKNWFDWRKFPSRLNIKCIKEIDLISQPFIKALHIPYVSPKQGVFTKGKKRGEKTRCWGFTHLLCATSSKTAPKTSTRPFTHSASNNATHSKIDHCQSEVQLPRLVEDVQVHSRAPITMRKDGSPPSLHTSMHTPGRTVKPGAGLCLLVVQVSCIN